MALPLLYCTSTRWGAEVLKDLCALLSDHVHLEKKAAINAMGLLSYCPHPPKLNRWNEELIQIAREESQHMSQVHKLLVRRGGTLPQKHKNAYAHDLYKHIRKGQTPQEQADRLLVTGLIEARSCERFALLAQAAPDAELQTLYSKLHTSEFSHYETYVEMARLLQPEEEIDRRWRAWLELEAEIIQRQARGPFIHSADV